MKKYVALLRGINVGGQKKIKMQDLRNALSKGNLKEVQTYIQSGNIVFETESNGKENLSEEIHSLIKKDFGFEVPVLVISADEILEIINQNPFAGDEDDNRLYFVLLKEKPQEDRVQAFNEMKFENEDFHVTDECVYLACKKGYGNAKLNNNLVESKLKVEATTRNLRTLLKLMELANKT
nr:DUF1697 domain-containing protein [Allomuricauda sp.]